MIRDCVFCKIVQGQIPCDKVYEDDLVLAFLDIAPLTLGHTLIIPKEHHTSITTLPVACCARMMEVAPRLGSALMRATEAGGFNLLLANGTVAGQVVPHTHLHVVPRQVDDAVVMPTSHIAYPSSEVKLEILAKARARLQ
jgi:histidine triad (HIT) family protein